jgi:uncharacterized protein YlaI
MEKFLCQTCENAVKIVTRRAFKGYTTVYDLLCQKRIFDNSIAPLCAICDQRIDGQTYTLEVLLEKVQSGEIKLDPETYEEIFGKSH